MRRRALQATGELARRIERRRAQRIERALACERTREPVREAVRVRVPVVVRMPDVDPAASPVRDARVHASVQVGSIHGADFDDVGLLESAMRRAATRRALVTPIDDRSEAHRTDWGGMLGEDGAVERARRVIEALGALPLLAMVLGVAMTFYPLVRPLDDVAPWFALGGLALVMAGVLGARWSRRRDGDDLDDLDDE